MLKNPSLYSVSADYVDPSDPTFLQKRSDIIHTAAVLLEKAQLLKYNRATGAFQSTELGKIASHYYVTYNSMQGYNKHLRSGMGMLELCRVFAGSEEFRLIPASVGFNSFLHWALTTSLPGPPRRKDRACKTA